MNTTTGHSAIEATLVQMDDAWATFRTHLQAIPSELLEVRLSDGSWTRKQMLAHISTWHDLTTDRLIQFADSGKPPELEDKADAINARAARAAEGRPTGEILLSLEESYRRVRREVGRLTDAQLVAHDDWAAAIIAGNTYEHYAEHLADLDVAYRTR